MTEKEWLTGTDPQGLLTFASERVSRRKLLLLACAIAETVLSDPTTLGGQGLELVERWADGALASEPVEEADLLVMRSHLHQESRVGPTAGTPHWAVGERLMDMACSRAMDDFPNEMLGLLIECRWNQVWEGCELEQATVDRAFLARLRDIAGNPFRATASVRPEWLAANDGQVPRLARAVYDERRYKELPYLADALEDAGCDDEAILGHLRGPGPHVRGCWALDLVLGLT